MEKLGKLRQKNKFQDFIPPFKISGRLYNLVSRLFPLCEEVEGKEPGYCVRPSTTSSHALSGYLVYEKCTIPISLNIPRLPFTGYLRDSGVQLFPISPSER